LFLSDFIYICKRKNEHDGKLIQKANRQRVFFLHILEKEL